MNAASLIRAARGERPVDLLLKNAVLVNVFTGRTEARHIAVADGFIAGFGRYDALEVVDLENRYVVPGFIDAHVHIESAMTCVSEFVRAVLPCGTTTVVADPHEIANVMGVDGIEYMLGQSAGQPMNIYFSLPSCVPATEMETAGARLDAKTLAPFLQNSRIPALAEMMNFPGVINCDKQVLLKIEQAVNSGKPVDGHSPGLSGKDLYAYLSAGVASDHECTSAEEAEEKLSAGMHIMIREGTAARNLLDLLPAVTVRNSRRMMWCTDDRHPHDILRYGHIDGIVRKAVSSGLDPVTAVQMATLNPASYFNLSRTGAVSPGMRADMIVSSDLGSLKPEQVYSGGVLAAENGRLNPEIEIPEPSPCPSSMNVCPDGLDFRIQAGGENARIIVVVPGQVVTGQKVERVKHKNGLAVADPKADILKIVVVERHRRTGNIGKGFVSGFSLKRGALASSVAHDSHNIIAVGADDKDLEAAVRRIVDMKGGLCAAAGGEVKAELSLPVAGLMSTMPLNSVSRDADRLIEAARALGCRLEDPFMTLSFLALPVIPELKITDMGLFDAGRFEHVPVFVDQVRGKNDPSC